MKLLPFGAIGDLVEKRKAPRPASPPGQGRRKRVVKENLKAQKKGKH